MRWRYRIALALVVLIGLPFYWLLIDRTVTDVPERQIDIAELRKEAARLPGPRPTDVAMQVVGWERMPGNVLAAGTGLKRQLVSFQAYHLRRPGDGGIVIDSGVTPASAHRLRLEKWFPGAQREVEAKMRGAALVVFTHEHSDHLDGLVEMAGRDALPGRVMMTPAQAAVARAAGYVAAPFDYSGMTAIAPGVVLMKSPGHTPGSQMIFARLADGREYLFTGDTATMGTSWQLIRPRSRLMADFLAPEDRAAVTGWLRAIRKLKRANPALHIIAGHDYAQVIGPDVATGIKAGFSPGSDPLLPVRTAPVAE